MTAADLLESLTTRGIRVSRRGGDLHIDAPRGALTPELREELVAKKPELLALLSHEAFVAEALRTFPGSQLPEVARADLKKFRALAQRHFPNLSSWDRLLEALRGLSRIVNELEARNDLLGAARARAVWALLEQLTEEWRRNDRS